MQRLGGAGRELGALLRAAISELDTAEVETGTPRARAVVRTLHGQILEVRGFPVDAYAWHRSALNDGPVVSKLDQGLSVCFIG